MDLLQSRNGTRNRHQLESRADFVSFFGGAGRELFGCSFRSAAKAGHSCFFLLKRRHDFNKAPGIATKNKKLLGAPGHATRSK